jgi:signal transduction histidine kinase
MSVVAVQAGLAQYVFDSDPATAVSALETIAESSRQALDETRLLVKLLRVAPYQPTDDTSAADFAPGLNRLDKLTDRVTATGVPVKLVVNGTARALTASADLCAYRIIQESLTNVLRHAGPARATVTLTYETDRLEVRVIDDGRGTPENPDRDTAGHGLIGMRERAKLCGGALAAGTHPTKGFEVALTLPIEPSALDQAELAKPNIADRS